MAEIDWQNAMRAAMLDHAALLCKVATEEAAMVHSQSSKEFVRTSAWRSLKLSMEAMGALISIGAAMPFKSDPTEEPDGRSYDLLALASLDTPDARSLLSVLEIAETVANRVDTERGRVVSGLTPIVEADATAHTQQRGVVGTDLAESVREIITRLRVEIYGPRGRE